MEFRCAPFVLALALTQLLGADSPLPLSRAVDVRQSKYLAGAKTVPTRLQGVVTAMSGWKNSFFLQDASGAISVDRLETTPVLPGDEVEVIGHASPGLFAPIVVSTQTKVLRHRGLPIPQVVTYHDLAQGGYDSRFVQTEGVVHAAHVDRVWGENVLILELHTPGGAITIHVIGFPRQDFTRFVDSTVRVTGVSGTVFNERRQMIGLRLFVSDLDQITIVKPGSDMASMPITPVGNLMTFDGPPSDQRVHVSATVTYRGEAGDLYLQQEGSAIHVEAPFSNTFKPGDRIDAWGFTSNSGYTLSLKNAILRPRGKERVPKPAHVAASDVLKTESGFTQAPYNGLLVDLEGIVAERLPSTRKQLWEFREGPVAFQAQLSVTKSEQRVLLETGTRVSLTGICVVEPDESGNFRSFRILLRSAGDVRVLNAPFWTSTLLMLSGILLFVLTGSFVVWLTHRRANHPKYDVPLSRRLKFLFTATSGISAALVAVIGLSFLSLWKWKPAALALVQPDAKPYLALAMLGGAAAVLLNRRQAKRMIWLIAAACTLFVMIVGGLLMRDPSPSAPPSGFCLLLLGSALALTGARRSTGISQFLAIAAGVVCSVTFVGSLYGNQLLYGAGAHLGMPIITAAGLFLLSAAVLFRYPDEGAMVHLCSSSSGGIIATRVMPVAFFCPVILGYARLQGQLAGFYGTRFGLTLFALANVVSFCFLVWVGAALLNRLDAARSVAERTMRNRDEKLEMVFEGGAIGDWTWEASSDVLTAHRSVWKMWGETGREGSAPAEWFRIHEHPMDREFAARELQKAIQSGQPLDLEYRVIWSNGTVRWLACRATPVYGADGSLIGMNGLNIDITDRKLAQIRQQESETLFRELADAMPQIVWTSDSHGNNDYYNRRWYEYTGLLPGELWERTVHPDDVAGCVRQLARCLAEGQPFQYELRLLQASDRTYRWHLARSVPVRDSAGKIERWFGTSTDIEDFRRASSEIEALNSSLEERVQQRSLQLAESEVRYQQLVESVNDYAIFMLDSVGNIITWNAGAQRSNGYTSAEILGRHFSLFYPPEALQKGHPAHELAFASTYGSYHEEGWRVRKDGSTYWASVVINAMRSSDGQISGFSKVVRDMTEQKRAEQLLISAQQRAEEASQTKSNFLAAMSHEIRTPMNAILGMADLLWETELDSIQEEYVGRFRRAGSTLLTLINDILDLSKIESQKFELESVEFSLAEILERITELMGPKARLKGIALTTRIAPELPATLIGDPARLQQILVNLIGNAIKFTEHGSVALNVAPHRDNAPNHFEFSITDTGIGISEDKFAAIFEDFTQAENSTTRRFGGTGLGLGICRRLAKQMGGQLDVQSVIDKGSTFCFDVFLKIGLANSDALDPKEKRDLLGAKVLIVDDTPTNRLIQVGMCARWGMYPIEASSVTEACELVAEARRNSEPFDLVLLDHLMPDTQGFEALAAVRKAHPGLRVIVTSSDSQPGDVTLARTLGAADYITKPIRSKDLLAVISAAFHTHSATRPVTPARDPEPAGPVHILIAEDSMDNRFLLAAYLKKGPSYHLTFVTNGEEALDKCGQQEFDLILMDIQMPVMDGLTAATRIRELEQSQSRRSSIIIALTANALVEDAEKALIAGCNAHLSKPISKERLIPAIESYRESYQSCVPC